MTAKKNKGKKNKGSSSPKTSDNVIQFEPRSSSIADGSGEDSLFSSSGEIDLDTLGEADEIMIDALNAGSSEESVRLAREALALTEDCADAWILLGHLTESLEEATGYFNKGLEAAQRVLGEKPFVEDVGHFWGLIETRPFMRAIFALAGCMEGAGNLEDAVNTYRVMLTLNPNDNQGARYHLARLLVEMRLDKEAEELFERYEDDFEASWNYSRALTDFRKHGDSEIANESLEAALWSNDFVPEYLLGRRVLPDGIPPDYAIGDEDEAISYVILAGEDWKSEPGALAWLESRPLEAESRNKKDSGKGTARSGKNRKEEDSPLFESIPSDHSMEGFIRGMSSGGGEMTPVDEAQEVMFEAWEASTPEEGVRLAKKALSISEDCADAYNLLARATADTPEEAIALHRKALEAGKRALGEDLFEKSIGNFWDLAEAHPYMSALSGLAECLEYAGKREEAVEQYWEMLRLNPNDDQGVRDVLLSLLIQMGRDEDAEKLYRRYKEERMTSWIYPRALLDFRKHGDSVKANGSLTKALKKNNFVPDYLLGRRRIPRELPDCYDPGDNTEAAIYAEIGKTAWKVTPGALFWLKSRMGK